MKIYIFLIVIFFCSCIKQVDSVQNNIVQLVAYIDTYGEAMDVDLTDSHMVVAANYHGFIVYDINRDNSGNISNVDSIYSDSILDDTMGDNRAQEVIISKNHNIAFITDIYDKIWLHKLGVEVNDQYADTYLQDCYGGTWLNVSIDDQTEMDKINVFSLVKHSSSESDDEGTVGDFDEYSTSVVWKGLKDISSDDLFPEQNSSPACEFSYNFGILPEVIHYNDGLLAISNGELGVKVLSQIDESSCFDSNTLNLIEDFNPIGNIDEDRIACENSIFDYNSPGLGGIFEPKGGFHPKVYASFDLPGEVNEAYVKGRTIISGLSTSNGCYISLLDDNGIVIDNLSIANGYTINGISEDNGILALSAGKDGVLLYQWNESLNANYIGQIQTPYSNKVKVDGNNILISTEDGVFIYILN
tara:strand:- start:12072 stop:13316 length:1245 start_codon:yes stop_codon:yes gene_type:complete